MHLKKERRKSINLETHKLRVLCDAISICVAIGLCLSVSRYNIYALI